MIQLVCAPETLVNPSAARRFLVHGHLNGVEIASFWVPTDCDCF